MLSLAHTIISLPFGFYLDKPLVIFILAAGLHFIADMLPHWNVYPQNFPRFPYGLVAFDVFGGLVFALVLTGADFFTLPVLAAIAGGNAPDVIHSLWMILGGEKNPRKFPRWTNRFFKFHERIQFELVSPARGLISQVVGMVIAVALIT
jgi:hypothetical protein